MHERKAIVEFVYIVEFLYSHFTNQTASNEFLPHTVLLENVRSLNAKENEFSLPLMNLA